MYDIYALAGERNLSYIYTFLGQWAKDFSPLANEYEVPQFSENPRTVYNNVDDLILYLVKEQTKEQYTIYWNGDGPENIRTAILNFTTDGHLIVGISIQTTKFYGWNNSTERELEQIMKMHLKKLAKDVDAIYGGVFYEHPPPGSASDFISEVKLSFTNITP